MLDLPLAGRPTCLCWRKRRFRCRACARSFTASHPELPPRQRVTHRFRRHLFARARCGAHAEITREERDDALPSRARLPAQGIGRTGGSLERSPALHRLDEAAHRPGSQALAAVVSDPATASACRGARRAQPPSHVERYLRSPDEPIEVVAINPYDAYRQAVKPHYRERGSAAIPSTSCAAPTRTRHSQVRAPAPRPACFAWLKR